MCPGSSANNVGKTEKTLFENVERACNDKDNVVNIHLSECIGVQHMFNIAKLAPSLFFGSIVDDEQDARTLRINLVQMNARITGRVSIGIFFFLKKQLKLKQRTRF